MQRANSRAVTSVSAEGLDRRGVHQILFSALLVAGLLATAHPTAAQSLVGRVLDAGSEDAVVGAMVTAVGAGGEVGGRTLTNREGLFSIDMDRSFQPIALRVERIGYETEEFADRDFSLEGLSVLRVASAPIQIDGISTAAERLCGADLGRDQTVHDLWEEARKSLRTQVLSSREQILTFETEQFVRSLDPNTSRVVEQTTRRARLSAASPYRAITVGKMTRDGWAEESSDGGMIYYAPDASLLLSDEFANHHCFTVGRSTDGILLEFEPNRERSRVPEIEGTMILDRSSLALTELRFTYVGLPNSARGPRDPDGEIHFYGAPNGMRVVRSWAIRTPVMTLVRTGLGERLRIDYVREAGGRVLRLQTREEELVLGPIGPAEVDVRELPIAERLVTWTEDDRSAGGVALFLENRLSMPITITGIGLDECENVGISCQRTHPVSVELEPGESARLLVVPREDATRPIEFVWTYGAENTSDR